MITRRPLLGGRVLSSPWDERKGRPAQIPLPTPRRPRVWRLIFHARFSPSDSRFDPCDVLALVSGELHRSTDVENIALNLHLVVPTHQVECIGKGLSAANNFVLQRPASFLESNQAGREVEEKTEQEYDKNRACSSMARPETLDINS